jgi:hypothetical protein
MRELMGFMEPLQPRTAISQQIPDLYFSQPASGEGSVIEGLDSHFVGEIKSIALKPALVEPEEVALRIAVVDLDLLADQLLVEVIILVFLPSHLHLLDIVEDPLQLIEADVAGMMPVVQLQVLLDLVVLLDSQPVVLTWTGYSRGQGISLRVNWLQVDVVTKFDVLGLAGLVASRTVPIYLHTDIHR